MIILGWIVALVTLFSLVTFIADLVAGAKSVHKLAEIPETMPDGQPWPRVSVVIAGRNEERNLEKGLQSVLGLDYPDLEIVFVNDRSTDRTGEVAGQLAARDARLRIVTVAELPPHWVGKNHALHLGAASATGEWILFTDADIIFERTVLRRAVVYLLDQHLDHLTAGAQLTGPTLSTRLFMSAFLVYFMLYARPWRARNADPRNHVGIGAFNLVRATKYRQAGGHAPIAMRPDDDMMLAKLLKQHGGREALINAVPMISVEWYASIPEVIRGLEKNSFAVVHYSILRTMGSTVMMLMFAIWPWIALFVTHGVLRGLEIAIITLILLLAAAVAFRSYRNPAYALAFPFGTLLFIYTIWNSALKAQWNGGINWRGTLYPLAELRKNKI